MLEKSMDFAVENIEALSPIQHPPTFDRRFFEKLARIYG
jgi:hypothetical protein